MEAESSRQERRSRSPSQSLAFGAVDAVDASLDVEVAAEKYQKMRIVDCLHDSSDDEDDAEVDDSRDERRELLASPTPVAATPTDSSSSPSTSKPSPAKGGKKWGEANPGSNWLAWFSCSRRLKKKKKKKKKVVGKEREEDKREEGLQLHPPLASDAKPEEISLNIGMGFGMLCLVAKWEAEFNKMTEIRVQMELLLKEIKEQVPRRYGSSSILGSNGNFPSSSSDYCIVNKDNVMLDKEMLLHIEETNSATEPRGSNDKNLSESKKSLRMDQMEAELEFELERLQLSLDEKDSLESSGQERMELDGESIKSSESFSGESWSYNDPNYEEEPESFVVSASELERRLHELLHTRQQKRIEELESALEFTKRRLVEKDIEISQLRDDTRLASLRGNV